MAIAVVFAIGVIALVVVAHGVGQCETVVRADEVDAGPGPPTAPVEAPTAGCEAFGQRRCLALVAFPEDAHRVAELVVPFSPSRWESAHLVATRPDIPRLGNKLDARQDRVLPATLQESAAFVEAVRLARQDSRQVEAEAVDMHFGHPVPQAVGHHLEHARVTQVDGVPGPRVVDVIARPGAVSAAFAVRHQAVVAGVVDALERQRRAEFVAFGRVVVDHVHDHFESVRVEAVDHVLELVDVRAVHVALVEREEADGVVAPIVGEALVGQERLVQEHLHRQQLDAGHAQVAQGAEHLVARESGKGAAKMFRHCGVRHGEATHMRFIEDRLVPGHAHRAGLGPLKAGIDHHALRHEGCAVALVETQVAIGVADRVAEHLGPPFEFAHVRLGVGVEQQLVVIETVSLQRRVRAMHPQAVACAELQSGHEAVPDLIGVFRQRDATRFVHTGTVVDADIDPRSVRGEHGEIHAIVVESSAKGMG